MRRRLKVAQSHVFRSATVSVSGISKHAYCIDILGTHLADDVKIRNANTHCAKSLLLSVIICGHSVYELSSYVNYCAQCTYYLKR